MMTVLTIGIGLSSCSTRFAVTSGEENLNSLTKITDYEDPCIYPNGGDNGKDLFFAVFEKRNTIIFIKKRTFLLTQLVKKQVVKITIGLLHTIQLQIE